jgi:hypothetical protein
MKNSLFKLACACALATASVLVPLSLWRHLQTLDHQRAYQVRENAQTLAGLCKDNLRLSNLVAHATNSGLPASEFSELLRLRSEIGQLRYAFVEATNLAARNAQLTAALTNKESRRAASELPEGKTVLAHWARDQLAFSGYSNPSAALETTLWAMAQGDTNALAQSVTPEIQAKMLRQDWYEHGTPAEELAASTRKIADSLEPANGFYVVDQRATKPDQVVLDVYFEGEGRIRKFAMKKVGDGWMFNALGRAEAIDSDVHESNSAWP